MKTTQSTPAAAVTIVVAWTEETSEIVPGQTWRSDLGERPKYRPATEAKACMWMGVGTKADIVKARAWVTKEYPTGRTYVYPTTEQEPLIRARKDILAGRVGR